MYVNTVPLWMRPDDWRSRNRLIPLGSIRSDIVAASRVFRVLFVSLGFGLSAFFPQVMRWPSRPTLLLSYL
jgi:hypothetical protein